MPEKVSSDVAFVVAKALDLIASYAEQAGRMQAQLEAIVQERNSKVQGQTVDEVVRQVVDDPRPQHPGSHWVIKSGARWFYPGAHHRDEPSCHYVMRDGGIVFASSPFGRGWVALPTSGGDGQGYAWSSLMCDGSSQQVQFLVEVEPLSSPA